MIEILDENLKKIDILRKYTFAQYTDKFREIGTFKIDARLEKENLYLLDKTKEYYVLFDSSVFGKIEDVKKVSDSEYERTLELSGRLGTLLFTKRVIAGTIKFKGTTAQFVRDVIYNEIVKDAQSKRYVDIDIQYDDKDYLDSFCSTLDKQVTGGYVWDNVQTALEQDKLGLYFVPIVQTEHIPVNSAEPTNISKWSLVVSAGKDRTKGNKKGNTPVVFSQSLSNIARTDYEFRTEKYCNVAYVAGEGEEDKRKWYEVYQKKEVTAGMETKTGWQRNELWIDARDIQSENEDGSTMTEQEYEKLIGQRAEEKFTENTIEETYNGTLTEANKQYVYGIDYVNGDLVTIVDDELGIEIEAQITGVTRTIEGVREIVDIEFTYGTINRNPVEQIGSMESVLEKHSNDIKYLENKAKKTIDYVVEEGKYDIWSYRKWNSGIAECWGIVEEVVMPYASNTFLMSKRQYPFIFKEPPIDVCSVAIGNGIGYMARTYGSTDGWSGVVWGNINNKVNISVKVKVIGRWR